MRAVCSRTKLRARDFIVDLAVHGKYHFTSTDMRSALDVSNEAVRQAISRLTAKGEIASPARGFYVIVPPEYRRLGCLPGDQFIPALMEQRAIQYYVGLLSAAQYHGAAHQRPQELQVLVDKNRHPILCGSVKVVFISRRKLDAVPVEHFNNPRGTVVVSSVEATVIDLVGYMQRAGGVDRVAGILSELGDALDPLRLVEVSRNVSVIWAQRLGFLLDFVGMEHKTDPLRKYVHQNTRNFTRLLPNESAIGSRRSLKWHLLVNTSIEVEA